MQLSNDSDLVRNRKAGLDSMKMQESAQLECVMERNLQGQIHADNKPCYARNDAWYEPYKHGTYYDRDSRTESNVTHHLAHRFCRGVLPDSLGF